MSLPLTIGDFARMTHLSVKALRHYHELGLLVPAEVDQFSGYRRYDVGQVTTAQVIRRLRELDMPLEGLRQLLQSHDPQSRNQVIVGHLQRMERQLRETEATVQSLRALLERPTLAELPIDYRRMEVSRALVIRDHASAANFARWWQGAFSELRAALAAAGVERAGPDGALYFGEFFEQEFGEVVAFTPIRDEAAPAGRVEIDEIPAAELALTTHQGAYEDLDQAYAALGKAVAERAIGVDGPIREYYLVTPFDTEEVARWRTRVGWPVFLTG